MISVIIPTINEQQALPATLARVLEQTGDFEVIVVDGGSNDGTREIVAHEPRARLLVAPKGRASQMNAGARAARGDWLLFLHADTLLPDVALAAVAALEPSAMAGGFRHRFAGADPRLRLISWIDNTRCAFSRIIYGDQAMFVRRSMFDALGGFPAGSILEDASFNRGLLRATRPLLLDLHVVTDPRKFVQMGILKSVVRCTLILLCFKLHLPIPAQRFFSDIR